MKITLAAYETKPVTIAGGQFYLLSAFSKIAVKIISGGDSREFELSQGMGFKTREGERFFGVEIKDLGGIGQTIEFEISDREVFDNRSVGIVSVVNADKRRTEEGGAFLLARNFGPSEGLYSMTCMGNPLGSGKQVFVNKMVATSDVAGEHIFYVSNSYASDLLLPNVSGLVSGGAAISKRVCVNAPVSAVENFGLFTSTITSFGGINRIFRFYLSGSQTSVFEFTEPLMLCEGSGLYLMSRVPNSNVGSTYEFFEEKA